MKISVKKFKSMLSLFVVSLMALSQIAPIIKVKAAENTASKEITISNPIMGDNVIGNSEKDKVIVNGTAESNSDVAVEIEDFKGNKVNNLTKRVKSRPDYFGNTTDIRVNNKRVYSAITFPYYYTGNERDKMRTINLEQKYKTIRGRIGFGDTGEGVKTAYMTISLDGKIIERKFISYNNGRSDESSFNLDVTNGKKLEIKLENCTKGSKPIIFQFYGFAFENVGDIKADKNGNYKTNPMNLSKLSDGNLKVTATSKDKTVTKEIKKDTKIIDKSGELLSNEKIVPQKEMTAAASSEEVEKLNMRAVNVLDNNKSTIWHSKLNGQSPPHSITFNLGKIYNIDGLKYLPRQDSNLNGNITKYNIYTSLDGKSFFKAISGTWKNNKNEKTIRFENRRARYVKLEITSGEGGFASAAEINIINLVSEETDDGTDSDKDGISDWLEEIGYMVNRNKIVSWNGDKSKRHYKSNPMSWSTSGDAYSDKMKVSGLEMDNNVLEPAKTNPLVAAIPSIKISMNSFEVIPINQITDKEGGSQQKGYSNSVATKDEQTNTVKVETKVGAKFSVGTNTGVEGSFEYTFGWTGAKTYGKTATVANTTSKIKNWDSAKTTDISKAAKLKLNLKYINEGSSAARNVNAKFNIKLGNKIIATISPYADTYKAPILTTSAYKNRQSFGPIVVYKDARNEDIFVTLDELKAIQLGAPISIEPVAFQGDVVRWDNSKMQWISGGDYNTYNSQVESKTASIVFEWKDGKNQEFKIAAKNPYYNPHMTLGKAIKETVGIEEKEDGIYIKGNKLSNKWNYYFSDSDVVADEIKGLINSGKGFADLELKAGQRIVVRQPSDAPKPFIAWSQYTKDNKYILANVTPGTYPIGSVKAQLKINGVIKEIELEAKAGSAFYQNKEPLNGQIDFNYPGKIIVKDGRGEYTSEKIISKPDKEGLMYNPLDTPANLIPDNATKNVESGQYDISLQKYKNAKAVALQVESENWDANSIDVKVGDVNVKLPMERVVPIKWKIQFKDSNNKVYIKEGTEKNKNIPDIQSFGIPNDSLTRAQFIGSDGYRLELYEGKNYTGRQYIIDAGDNIKASSGFLDYLSRRVSSMRIVYTGLKNQQILQTTGSLALVTNKNEYKWTSIKSEKGKEVADISSYNISDNSLTHMWNNGNNPLVVELYEDKNFKGRKTTMYVEASMGTNNAGWRKLSDVGMGEKVSSYKVKVLLNSSSHTDTKAKNLSRTVIVPVTSSTLPVTWKLNNGLRGGYRSEEGKYVFKDANVRVKLLGYFSKEEGYKYTEKVGQTRILKPKSNINTKISTGVKNAKGFLYQIKIKNLISNNTSVTINGVTHYFGLNKYSSRDNDDILFVPAGSDPSVIDVSVKSDDWTRVLDISQVEIKMIGYFSQTSDLKYVVTNPLTKLTDADVTGTSNGEKTYSLNKYVKPNTVPQSWLINVPDVGLSKNSEIKVNNVNKNLYNVLDKDYNSLYVPIKPLQNNIVTKNLSKDIRNKVTVFGYFH